MRRPPSVQKPDKKRPEIGQPAEWSKWAAPGARERDTTATYQKTAVRFNALQDANGFVAETAGDL